MLSGRIKVQDVNVRAVGCEDHIIRWISRAQRNGDDIPDAVSVDICFEQEQSLVVLRGKRHVNFIVQDDVFVIRHVRDAVEIGIERELNRSALRVNVPVIDFAQKNMRPCTRIECGCHAKTIALVGNNSPDLCVGELRGIHQCEDLCMHGHAEENGKGEVNLFHE